MSIYKREDCKIKDNANTEISELLERFEKVFESMLSNQLIKLENITNILEISNNDLLNYSLAPDDLSSDSGYSGLSGLSDIIKIKIMSFKKLEEMSRNKGINHPSISDEIIEEIITEVSNNNSLFHDKTTLSNRCIESEFRLNNFIKTKIGYEKPIITPEKVNNLKKLFNEILLPIVVFYKNKYPELSDLCILQIVNALMSPRESINVASGHSASLHITGMAVDFGILNVQPSMILKDIESGNIPIEYGVLSASNGTHITLPYSVGNEIIRNVIIKPDHSISGDSIEYLWK